MKVAYLGIKGVPSQWGADRVVEAIARELAGRHEITVYCNRRHTPAAAALPGIKLVRIPSPPGKHLQPVVYFSLSALHAFFQRYDVVHIHNAEACFVAPLLRLRHPVMATSHGPAYARDKWGKLGKRLIRLLDVFFVCFPCLLTSVSRPMAEDYQRRYGKPVHYLPNGVDAQPAVDSEAAANTLRARGSRGPYRLFAAGRLDPTKGCHLLLQAYNSALVALPLVVIGNMATLPAYSRELQSMAGERVRFIPFIEAKGELLGFVRGAQVFVFPSMVEAMSMMLLEAVSLGVPIVCSDIPENTAVLDEHALYFRSGDTADLAEKLQWALDHPEEMTRLGAAARRMSNRTLPGTVLRASTNNSISKSSLNATNSYPRTKNLLVASFVALLFFIVSIALKGGIYVAVSSGFTR